MSLNYNYVLSEGGQSPPLDAGLPMTQISEESIIVRCPCGFNKVHYIE